MVVYADLIFIINSVSSYIMLYVLGKIVSNFRIKIKRLVTASLCGGLTATLIFCLEMQVYLTYLFRIISVFLMIFIAFFDAKRQILYQIGWFSLMSGIMMSSMIFIVSAIQNSFGMAVKMGIMYFDIPTGIFVISFIGAYGIMLFFVKLFKNRKNKRYYIMTVTHNDKTITVPALFDSGNLLKEPITGKCVNIIEWQEIKKLFEAECEFSEIENYAEDMKLWVIPFNSLGNSSGILFAFIADRVDILEEHKTADKTFIGIYNGSLSKNGEYHALLNAGMF